MQKFLGIVPNTIRSSKKNFHPRTISSLVDQRKVIVRLDFENGRTNRFFTLKPDSFDPYLFTICQC